jgi:hypothetical protein
MLTLDKTYIRSGQPRGLNVGAWAIDEEVS